MAVEVAPIAHYHMGGVVADARMMTEVPGLLVAGEVVGGANGANRLSGNAITEALVFGRRAGRSAAERAGRIQTQPLRIGDTGHALDLVLAGAPDRDGPNTAEMVAHLQAAMADDVGPFRTAAKLRRAMTEIERLTCDLGEQPAGDNAAFDLRRLEWFDLRNMLLIARSVTEAAMARTESRGAHQREDCPDMLPQWQVNQVVRLKGREICFSGAPTAVAEAVAP
jgi:succinate dehydrogenase/fumarate reductase flavoprotein subunit